MPHVNILITRWGATAEQKAVLVRVSTQLLVDVLKEKRRMEMTPLRETAAQ